MAYSRVPFPWKKRRVSIFWLTFKSYELMFKKTIMSNTQHALLWNMKLKTCVST